MIDSEFLNLLRCPESQQTLSVADAALVRSLNEKIAAGSLKNRAGETVGQPLDGGLVRKDQTVLYPIRQDIPVLLIAESLALAPAATSPSPGLSARR